ncbi:MAG: TetR family transcriptional regulator [Kiritimatiellae bacterium]|nr:TetR family transcriptional regulator [Kiritimatiellia bacterium]
MITKTPPPKKRAPRADGLATRESILAAAELEFSARGYAAASLRAICRRARANAALANRYFGTKENLYRLVAQRLFGDLGAPMSALAQTVADADSWRAAVAHWIDDFLYMALPTETPQRRCAALFRQEVSSPTRFHAEFKEAFGKPVYLALRDLLAMALPGPAELDLWTASVWSQVAVYALADAKWLDVFRPAGAGNREWADKVRDHVCAQIFPPLEYKKPAPSGKGAR